MEETKKTFFNGAKIKELREREKLTQLEFARKLNSSRQMVQRWESGDCDPQAETISMICNVFAVGVEFLFSE
jgi:transcriptional regulator with XRE-family HTH domain